MHNPEREWQIIPNTQEAIIDEATQERVHEVRRHRRRNNAEVREKNIRAMKQKSEQSKKRIAELDKLIERIYTDNVMGKGSKNKQAKINSHT